MLERGGGGERATAGVLGLLAWKAAENPRNNRTAVTGFGTDAAAFVTVTQYCTVSKTTHPTHAIRVQLVASLGLTRCRHGIQFVCNSSGGKEKATVLSRRQHVYSTAAKLHVGTSRPWDCGRL